MCTVTWLQRDDGYEVFCNRDELRTRKPAQPPRLDERNGVRYLAPVDADAGGAWVGVNEFGLTLCLVNHYPIIKNASEMIPPLRGARGVSPDPSTEQNTHRTPLKGGIAMKEYRSRGLLVLELLDCAAPEMVATRLEHENMAQYRSFILLAFALHSPARMLVWDEKTLHSKLLQPADLLVTSSSYKTEEVITSRRLCFAESVLSSKSASPNLLASFHRSHAPERSAYSVCMHRDDAETVSFTHVRVQNGFAELHYLPHSPCSNFAMQQFHLQLNENSRARR